MATKELFIFDMDGVLLDSEPFWREAQIGVLKQYGATITEQDCINLTMGKRIDDIADIWIERFNLDAGQQQLIDLILHKAAELIAQGGSAKEGIDELIDLLQRKGSRIALATSSSELIIAAVVNKLKLANVFELTLSADEVPNGKPSPDVYLEVCRRLGVATEHAIALEDSLTGVRAAVAANITTIAVPELPGPDFAIADHVVDTILEVIPVVQGYYPESGS